MLTAPHRTTSAKMLHPSKVALAHVLLTVLTACTVGPGTRVEDVPDAASTVVEVFSDSVEVGVADVQLTPDVAVLPDLVALPDLAELSPADVVNRAPECTDDAICGARRFCAQGTCVGECDPRAAGLTGLGCLHLAVDLPNATDTASGGGVAADDLPTALLLQNPWGDVAVEVIVRSVLGAGPVPGGTVTLSPAGSASVSLPNRNLAGTTRAKAAFAVESERPIVVMMMSPVATARSTSAVRLLPASSGALAFAAVTGPTRAFVTIAAVEDDTLITLRPTGATQPGSGLKAMVAGGTYTVTLSASEVLHLEAAASVELTGTRVDATKPVAVFSGSATTTWGSRCCGDMVAEQLPPRTALGTVTLVTPGPPRGAARDSVRVVSLEDGTIVEVATPEPLKVTLATGGWVDVALVSATLVTTSKPALVALHLAAAHARTAQGDVCLQSGDCPKGQSCLGAVAATPGLCLAACEPAQDDCPAVSHRCLDRFGALPEVATPGVCARRTCDPVTGACAGGAVCDPSLRCREPCTAASTCLDPTETCGLFGVALMCGASSCQAGASSCPANTSCVVAADGTAACTSGCNPAPKCETVGYRCVSDALYAPGSAPFSGAYCVAPPCAASSECPDGFECAGGTCVPRGDPALVVLPPVERHALRIPLLVPDGSIERWLAIVAPVDAIVRLDGVVLTETQLPAGPGGWRAGHLAVTPGLHVVTSDLPVAASLFGLGPEMAWAASGTTPLGLDSSPVIPPPEDVVSSDVSVPEIVSADVLALDTDTGLAPPTWTQDVAPLLALRCAPCHTGGSKLGGLSVDTYAATQLPSSACAGGNKGVAIAKKVNGDPGCTGTAMPPTGPSLTPAERAVLEAWIAAGQPE